MSPMMSPYALTNGLTGVGANNGNVSLHSAFDYAGANEVSTARVPIVWGTIGVNSQTTMPLPSLLVPAPPGTAISWIGIWTSSSPSLFVAMYPLRSVDQGPYMVDSTDYSMLRAPRHQCRVNDNIVLWGSNEDTSNPSPVFVYEGLTYTVLNVIADSIQLNDPNNVGNPITFTSGVYGRIETIYYDTVPPSGFYPVDVSLLAGL